MSSQKSNPNPPKLRMWGSLLCGVIVIGVTIQWVALSDEEASATSVNARVFDAPPQLTRTGAAMKDRAFWGAPPPMPHSFTKEWDAKSCLQCHAKENDLANRFQALSPIPHARLSQCQQCHVRAPVQAIAEFVASDFIGVGSPGKGSRATPVSPPTIPHDTFMRDNCLSCHGPGGEQRIATSHPYRSQCQQCHVSATTREFSRVGLRSVP